MPLSMFQTINLYSDGLENDQICQLFHWLCLIIFVKSHNMVKVWLIDYHTKQF